MENNKNVISKEDDYFYNRLIDCAIENSAIDDLLHVTNTIIPVSIFEKRVVDMIKNTKLRDAESIVYLKNTPYYKNILDAILDLYNKGELDDLYMYDILYYSKDVPNAETIFNKIIVNVAFLNGSGDSNKHIYLREISSVMIKYKIDFKFDKENISNMIKAGFRPWDITKFKNKDLDNPDFILNFFEARVLEGFRSDYVAEAVKDICVTYNKNNRDVIYKVCESSDIALKTFMQHIVFPLSFTDKHFSRMIKANLYQLVNIQIFPESRYAELFKNRKFLINYLDTFSERFFVPEEILDKYFQKICEQKYSEYHWDSDADDDYYEDVDRVKTEYDDDRIENDEIVVSGGIYVLINQRLSAEFIRKNFKYFVKHNLLKALIKTQSIPFDCISENINTFVKAGHTNLLLEKQKCYEILSKIRPIEEYLDSQNDRDYNDD